MNDPWYPSIPLSVPRNDRQGHSKTTTSIPQSLLLATLLSFAPLQIKILQVGDPRSCELLLTFPGTPSKRIQPTLPSFFKRPKPPIGIENPRIVGYLFAAGSSSHSSSWLLSRLVCFLFSYSYHSLLSPFHEKCDDCSSVALVIYHRRIYGRSMVCTVRRKKRFAMIQSC